MVKLEHPTSKHQVTIKYANWKVFFFGWLWLAWHRDWGDAFFCFLSYLFTLGLAAFVWPFFAENRLVESYQRQGYKIIDSKLRGGWESPWAPVKLQVVLFGVVIILAVVIFLASEPPQNGTGSEQPSQEQPAEGVEEEPTAWTKVKSWSGTSSKKTETFEIKGSQWRITWTNKDTSGLGFNLLIIYVYKPGQEFTGEIITAEGNDVSYVYEKGTFYLDIDAASTQWSITVEDYL